MKKRKSVYQIVEEKGYQAFKDGLDESANPYPDWRTENGRNSVTFSRGFRNTWCRGWQNAKDDSGKQ